MSRKNEAAHARARGAATTRTRTGWPTFGSHYNQSPRARQESSPSTESLKRKAEAKSAGDYAAFCAFRRAFLLSQAACYTQEGELNV